MWGKPRSGKRKKKPWKNERTSAAALILQDKTPVSSLWAWWNNLADGSGPMLRRISAVGLHCIALYQPLRGFYCDLHINERLSVCSRYHFSSGRLFLSVFSRGWSPWYAAETHGSARHRLACCIFERSNCFENSLVLLTSSVNEWELLN